jgi:hypothetical protein
MKFRTTVPRLDSSDPASPAERIFLDVLPRRIKVTGPDGTPVCGPVKIRVAAAPFPQPDRCPRFSPRGFNLDDSRVVLHSMASPPRPARKLQELLDWRICGDQDLYPTE